MHPDRFDTLAKRLVMPTTRRATFTTAAAGGLLTALGFTRAVPETRAARGGTCVVQFTAQVQQGPSREEPVTPGGGRTGEVRGDLRFSLSASGNLDNASLTLADGTSLPVVGQATGHSLQLRIALAPRAALVAVGVGEQEIAKCRGAIDGVATGPQSGDLGDWHAGGVQQAGSGGQGATAAAQRSAAGVARDTTENGADQSGRAGRAGRGSGAGQPAAGTGSAVSGSGGNSGAGTTDDATQADTSSTSPEATAPSCPPGETYCRYVEECRDLDTSPLDCGACGTRCPSLVCQGGICLSEEEADQIGALQASCAEGLLSCAGTCIDPLTDSANCGQCGMTCAPPTTCSGGGCACPSGTVNCDATNAASCVDPLTDSTNCGLCGVVCEAGTTCQEGACVASGGGGCRADSGLTYCGGICVDLASDPANCGACGASCGGGPSVSCVGGACTYCLISMLNCGGVCVSPEIDSANCGGCGIVCAEGTSCQNGVCLGTDGAEGPPTTDAASDG